MSGKSQWNGGGKRVPCPAHGCDEQVDSRGLEVQLQAKHGLGPYEAKQVVVR